jgi:ABC-2 type transport system permease protein
MLYHLVKKDFLLVKKYLIMMCAAEFGFSVFLSNQISHLVGGFLIFFLTTLIVQYALFNSVSLVEYKYKGSALLCATPYTRSSLVHAKYLFNLAVFICCCILYTIAAFLFPSMVVMLNISTFGLSLLIITVVFGVIIPVQYQFGYEKTKFIFLVLIFVTPFVLPAIIKTLQANHVSPQISLPIPHILQELLPVLLAIIIGVISMFISVKIYSKKDL